MNGGRGSVFIITPNPSTFSQFLLVSFYFWFSTRGSPPGRACGEVTFGNAWRQFLVVTTWGRDAVDVW